MFRIIDLLKNTALAHPQKAAVRDEGGSVSYQKLWDEASAVRENLTQKGWQKGHAIGLLAPNNRHFLMGLFGASATDALVMPIHHQQSRAEILEAAKKGMLHAILCTTKALAKKLSLPIEPLGNYWLVICNRPKNQPTAAAFPDAAVMRFSSGTTGAAKGIVISHQAVLERINAASKVLNISENDVVLWVFPMAYHFVVSLLLYVQKAATIVVQNTFLAEEIYRAMLRENVTFFYASPTHIKLMAAYAEGNKIDTMRTVISTTAGANPADCLTFEKRFKINVQQAFGIMEVGLPFINQNPEKPESVGRPIPDFEVAIFDENQNLLPAETSGNLAVRGPGMFSGYLNPLRKKEDVLREGWFFTGDVATLSAQGEVTIKGRTKNVIFVHGNKVFPQEVEHVLNQFPGVKLSKVYGQKHALFGEIVVAEIVASAKVDTDELRNFCREKLSPFKVPQKFAVVEKIAMTDSGKIKRH